MYNASRYGRPYGGDPFATVAVPVPLLETTLWSAAPPESGVLWTQAPPVVRTLWGGGVPQEPPAVQSGYDLSEYDVSDYS